MSSTLRRLGLAGAAAAGALALVAFSALPAVAHVRLDGDSGTATVGTTATLVFRVPTESDTASTIGLTITFPQDEPFGSVQPLYQPGWDVVVTRADLSSAVTDSTGKQLTSYVQSVTWTATAGGIPAELYDTFTVRAGAIPDTDSIPLPALQTYSDGSTVDWSQIAQGGTTPEHPAPVLTIVPASTTTTVGAGPTATIAPEAAAGTGSSTGDGTAKGLGIGGLAAGGVGLILGLVALVRGERKPAATR